MKRKLRPRPPVTTAPGCVSQLTSMAIFGIDERRFLELLRDHADEIAISEVGKLRVVAVDDLRDLLARLATSDRREETDAKADDDEGDEQPQSVDDVLARIGRRRFG